MQPNLDGACTESSSLYGDRVTKYDQVGEKLDGLSSCQQPAAVACESMCRPGNEASEREVGYATRKLVRAAAGGLKPGHGAAPPGKATKHAWTESGKFDDAA